MTKILVADDNSNIQRTVIQALAHMNTEVVAVNNGQAAVRKVSEISPDIVLADIFMPVRNGYEVCEFVKKNPATAHIPVILLAGAFDPLDEREAQRVGADGILKKPFLPPDPLVNMVQTLLDRLAAMRVDAAPAIKHSSASSAPPVASAEPEVEEETEDLTAAERARKNRVSFAGSDQPLAFSSLLETPAESEKAPGHSDSHAEPNASDRTHKFDSPNFWKDEAAELDPLPEPTASSASTAVQEQEKAAAPEAKHDSAKSEKRDAPIELQPIDPLEFVRDEIPAAPPTVVNEQEQIVLDPSKYASLSVETAAPPELAKNPLDWMDSAPPRREAPHAAVPEAHDEPATHESIEDETAADEPVAAEAHSEVHSEVEAHDAEADEDRELEASPNSHSESHLEKDEEPSFAHHDRISSEASAEGPIEDDFAEREAHFDAEPVQSYEAADDDPPVHAETVEAHGHADADEAQEESEPEAVETHELASHSVPVSETTPALPSLPAQPVREPFALPNLDILKHDFTIAIHQEAPHADHVDEHHEVSEEPELVHAFAKPGFSFGATQMEASPVAPGSHLADAPVATGASSAEADLASSVSDALHDLSPVHAPSAAPAANGEPDAALVEAVVQRVLEKMRPQVIDLITREFLRPVVQALVHREIDKH